MADFKTHITVSTAIGVAYGGGAFLGGAHLPLELSPASCVLAGTLCSVSGMLPDLDSDSGVPLRESLTFASACIPMLLIDRFHALNWWAETIALAGAAIYGAVRFGVGTLLKKYTVHRGMFHSIPAAIIAGEIAFLLCTGGNEYVRAYKALAVVIGFMSHLVLDEIWSVKVSGGRIGLKSSSGTALKFWGGSMWANLSTYAKLALLSVLVFKDPMWKNVAPELNNLAETIDRQAHIPSAAQAMETVDGRLKGVLPGLQNMAQGGAAPATGGNPAAPLPGAPNQGGGTYATPGPGGVYIPQGTYVREGLNGPQRPYAAPPSIPQGYGPQGYGPQGYGPQGYGPQGYGPGYGPQGPGYAQPGYAVPPNYQQPMPGYPIPMGVGPGASRPRY